MVIVNYPIIDNYFNLFVDWNLSLNTTSSEVGEYCKIWNTCTCT